ncbi:hypothetical protein GIB67_029332 [Kingdonia uniflora]|uniref:Uncharacterized protein n=1 Tax=Kingdonia uniflora TaxID=39325 RepID=A0A7J7N8R2_9MAGN|nr:hypothetical protein GIB67_029332 [Kingdonia uniflora]
MYWTEQRTLILVFPIWQCNPAIVAKRKFRDNRHAWQVNQDNTQASGPMLVERRSSKVQITCSCSKIQKQ